MTVKNRVQRDEPSDRGAGIQQPVGTICCQTGLYRGAAMGLSLGLGWSLTILLRLLPHPPSTPSPNVQPRLHAVPAGSGITCSRVLTPLYLVLADDLGRRQRRGEDISAGPV